MLIRGDIFPSNVLRILKILILACLVLPYFWLFGLSGNLNLGLMLVLLASMNFFFFIKIKNPLSVIFLVTHFNYIILVVVFFLELPFSYLEQQRERDIYDTVVLLDFVFYLILGISLTRSKFDFSLVGHKLSIPTHVLYWLGVLCIMLNLFVVSRYIGMPYSEVHDRHTVFSEVGWLLCALSLLFDKRLSFLSKRSVLLYILMFLSLLFGARLQVSFFIIAFLIRFLFPVSKVYFYFSLALVICVGILAGVLRDLVGFELDIKDTFSTINQGASLRTSAVYLMAVNEGFFTAGDRFLVAVVTFLFSWLPSFVFDNVGHLNLRIMQFSMIQGNGGFIGSYLFLFFGYFGSFLFITSFSYLINNAIYRAPIFVALLITTSYRWQLYNLLPVIKVIMILLFLSLVFKLIKKLPQKGM
jgi:hypothetical protein